MPSIGEILARQAHRVPRRTALIFGDRQYTYQELNRQVNQTAHVLAIQPVHHGDRVALMAPNSDNFILAYYALLRLGAIVVPINVHLAPPSLRYQLEDSQSRLIVYDPALTDTVLAGTPTDVRRLSMNELEELSRQASPNPPNVHVEETDDAQILYTSGTTGRPKGVLMDHHRIIWTGLNVVTGVGLREGERLLHVAPLYHSAELDLFLMGGTYVGATHIVLGEFHPRRVLETLAEQRVTAFFGVPTMYQMMLREQPQDRLDLAAWRIGMFGAAPMPPATVLEWARRLPGLTLYNLAGLTEMGPGGVYLGGSELLAHPGAAGRPILNTEARIVTEDGRDTAPGEVGELILRGETLMKGYWNNPDATADAIRDGWLYTGDLAARDQDGLITLVDRKKDLIITGGMNVYSVEVEHAVLSHPAVLDCAVIGLPHPDYGETVTAVVTLVPGETLTLEELREHCRPLIADYKIPRRLFLGPIPRNASGKILKFRLRQQYRS